jgi:hypothetical protein
MTVKHRNETQRDKRTGEEEEESERFVHNERINYYHHHAAFRESFAITQTAPLFTRVATERTNERTNHCRNQRLSTSPRTAQLNQK